MSDCNKVERWNKKIEEFYGGNLDNTGNLVT